MIEEFDVLGEHFTHLQEEEAKCKIRRMETWYDERSGRGGNWVKNERIEVSRHLFKNVIFVQLYVILFLISKNSQIHWYIYIYICFLKHKCILFMFTSATMALYLVALIFHMWESNARLTFHMLESNGSSNFESLWAFLVRIPIKMIICDGSERCNKLLYALKRGWVIMEWYFHYPIYYQEAIPHKCGDGKYFF